MGRGVVNGSDLQDALSPRMAGSTEGMTLQVLAQIRDSLSAMGRDMRTSNEALADVRERVIRLEERDRRLDTVEAGLTLLKARVDVLEDDRAERMGGSKAWGRFLSWWGPLSWTIGIIFTVVFLIARAAGVLHLPESHAVRAEAQAIERKVERETGR